MTLPPRQRAVEAVNCFGIPDTYRGWKITQGADALFCGTSPDFDQEWGDELGLSGECHGRTWEELREDIDNWIADHEARARVEKVEADLAALRQDVLATLRQYVDDLCYPPQGDSIERRIAAANAVIVKIGGAA